MSRYRIRSLTYGGGLIELGEARTAFVASKLAQQKLDNMLATKSFEIYLNETVEVFDTKRLKTIETLELPVAYLWPSEAFERFNTTLEAPWFGSPEYMEQLSKWARTERIVIL